MIAFLFPILYALTKHSSARWEENNMELVESILTQNPCYKAGRKIAVKGLMLHSVGCPQPNAETFVKEWDNPESSRA